MNASAGLGILLISLLMPIHSLLHPSPNQAYRIRGKHMRDGKLKKRLRFTPVFTKNARKAISLKKRKIRQPELTKSSEEKSDVNSS